MAGRLNNTKQPITERGSLVKSTMPVSSQFTGVELILSMCKFLQGESLFHRTAGTPGPSRRLLRFPEIAYILLTSLPRFALGFSQTSPAGLISTFLWCANISGPLLPKMSWQILPLFISQANMNLNDDVGSNNG